jgi:hypothetical protein
MSTQLEMDNIFSMSVLRKQHPICSLDKNENIIKLEMCDFLTKVKTKKLEEDNCIEREDEEWVDAAMQWRKINASIKDLEKMEKECRQQLIAMAGHQNISGGGIKICKHIRKSAIDYGVIPELMGIDLDKYRKADIEYWKIS